MALWFNPHGLFGLTDGGSWIDSARPSTRLYNGFAPDGSEQGSTRNAGKRHPLARAST